MPFSHSARQLANTCANQWWFNRLLKIAFFFFLAYLIKLKTHCSFTRHFFPFNCVIFCFASGGKVFYTLAKKKVGGGLRRNVIFWILLWIS